MAGLAVRTAIEVKRRAPRARCCHHCNPASRLKQQAAIHSAVSAPPAGAMHRASLSLKLMLLLQGTTSGTSAEGPCDILGAAGNPCVAAHSTVRALYSNFSGPLYNLSKPDGTSKSIRVTTPGGYADKATHDAFCGPEKDCVIYNVFDQSPMKNHLGPR
jgi:hypothetical protein